MEIEKVKSVLSSRSELIESTLSSIWDNDGIPHLVVANTGDLAGFPEYILKDAIVVLSLATNSIGSFSIFNNLVSIKMAFSGRKAEVFIPVSSIVSLSEGNPGSSADYLRVVASINFEAFKLEDPSLVYGGVSEATRPNGKPKLTLVK